MSEPRVGFGLRAMRRARASAPMWIGFLVLGVVAVVLRRELASYDYRTLADEARSIPGASLAQAFGWTALSYLLLTGYDVLALRRLGRRLGYAKTAFTSFTAYVTSHNLGFAGLGGTAMRLRLYTRFGLAPSEAVEVIGFCGLSYWLGSLALGGLALTLHPFELPAELGVPTVVGRLVGGTLLAIVLAGFVWSARRREPLRWRNWRVQLPRPGELLVQLALGAVDWAVAAAVLYALLPESTRSDFPSFVSIFVVAQLAGALSHVPAGLGVFETVVLAQLPEGRAHAAEIAALVAYRGVYYLAPLIVGGLLYFAFEFRERSTLLVRGGTGVLRAGAGLWQVAGRIGPSILAALVFVEGALLLFAGALPAEPSRLAWVDDLLPAQFVDVSHFAASVVGAGLLVLSRGIARRLDAAWWLTMLWLVLGAAASVVSASHHAHAIASLGLGALLLAARKSFDRRAAFFAERAEPRWLLASGTVLIAFVWLGLFAHEHVEYRHELWWSFALEADAPRFLRAIVGVLAVVIVAGGARLLRAAPPRIELPTGFELERAAAIADRATSAHAHLALLGDKQLLFHPDGDAFLMFAVQGRHWIALGDPIGDPALGSDLVSRFLALVHSHGGAPVFYEVTADALPPLLEAGLVPHKIGEEARIDLHAFGLEGGERKKLRQALRHFEQDGCTFEVVPASDVAPLLPELRRVSSAWLATKRTREKGFSLGFFDETYLSRCPVAVVRRAGRIVAFANLWTSSARAELSVDLMRYSGDAPSSTMDALFAHLLLFGREQGYRWFNLGMAPLSGFSAGAGASAWIRAGAFLFQHGEHFYNFEGLREYKEKFGPVWRPSYVVTEGFVALPSALVSVTARVSGGVLGALRK